MPRTEEFTLGAVTHQHMLAVANAHATGSLYSSIASHRQRTGQSYAMAHPVHELAHRQYMKEADLSDAAKPVWAKKYVGKEIYTRRPGYPSYEMNN